MIRCEFRKLLQRASTRLVLLVLFAANAFLVWNQPLPGTSAYRRTDVTHILSLYTALPADGELALSALNRHREALFSETDVGTLLTGDTYTESSLFSYVAKRVEPVAAYDDMLLEIDENAQTLLLSGLYEPDSFGYRNILKSQEVYRQLWDIQPQMFYSGAVELLPGGRITDFVLVLLCLLTALELVCTERTGATLALIKPTYKGALPLICAKILAGLLVAVLGTGLLYGANLLMGLVRCGGFPMDAPIQSIFGFERSPWKITVGSYIAGFIAMKCLWAAAVTAMMYAACCIGGSVLECCGVFLLFAAPSLVFPGAVVSLISAGNTAELFAGYRNLNVLGFPVSTFAVSVSVLILVSASGFGGAVGLHLRTSPIISPRRSKKTKVRCRISTNLFLHEGRKLLLTGGGIWVLVGLMAVQTVTYANFRAYLSPMERLYIHYSETLSGAANPEKDDFIAQEEARFAGLYDQLEQASLAHSKGDLGQQAYDILRSEIIRQLDDEEVFIQARDQYATMKSLGCDYVCLTGYERLLGLQGQRDAVVLSIKLTIALILGLSSIHAVESETNMILLLHSVPRHRHSSRRKRIIASSYAAAAALITFVPHVAAIAAEYGLPGLLAHSNSVPLLKTGTRTVLAGLGVYAAVILCIAVLTAHVIIFISQKSKRTAATILFSSLLLLPAVCLLILS